MMCVNNTLPRQLLCCRGLAALLLQLCLLSIVANVGFSADPAPKKWAFLVGVSKYDKAGLNPLEYPESDMVKMSRALQNAGFSVHSMLGGDIGPRRATLANLKSELLEKFATKQVRQLNKNDVLLIVLSGHGLQMLASRDGQAVEDSFFCPVDATKSDAETMLSISELMQRVSANSGAENNLLVIDACRDNPSKGAKALDGSLVTALPVNTAVLFGSSAGTRSYESQKLQGGLLAHYFLEGIQGAAHDPDGEITWGTLVSYVKKSVSRNSVELIGQPQRPNDISNLQGESPLLAKVVAATPGFPAGSRAGEVRDDNGLKMKLVWCPPAGTTTKSSGFWIGQCEVTQAEWRAVMKDNPSWFRTGGEGADKVAGQNTDRFPVENVTWNQATQFCESLTNSERAAGRLPAGSVYRLPFVAEWEQAAGAALASGKIDMDSIAWHQGSSGFRPHEVGTREATAGGLYDMLGNVAEWCQDRDPDLSTKPPDQQLKMIKGGSWIDSPARCQVSSRVFYPANQSLNCYGFRIVLAPVK